jgi:hypothetical protein
VPHLGNEVSGFFFGHMRRIVPFICFLGFARDSEDLYQPGMSWVSIQLPLRIRIRIGPPHPLRVAYKRRLNGGGPSDETGKTEDPSML